MRHLEGVFDAVAFKRLYSPFCGKLFLRPNDLGYRATGAKGRFAERAAQCSALHLRARC
jgi:hypothetical protein